MKFFHFVLISLCISSCNFSAPKDPFEKEKLVNEIERNVFFKLNNEKGLIPFGTGGQMMDEIKMLCLAFEYRKEINIEAGRELLVASIQEYVNAVNAEAKILPYLGEVPFGERNVIIEIYVHDQKGSDFGADKLSLIVASQGVLKYKTFDPESNHLTTIHTETYEEALQKMAD